MDNKDDKRRQLIQAMLAQPADADPAERHLLPWRALDQHLSPLIGDNGFGALFVRTGRLLQGQYGWLTPGQSSQPLGTLFQTLNEDLAKAGPEGAALANAALLLTFTRLLSDLIGEVLTTRLIDAAWHGAPPPKHAGEQK